MRKFTFILFALLLGMSSASAYDFSSVCPTGQTLYYNITDLENHEVEFTYPSDDPYNPWDDFTELEGSITLPETVTYNGEIYTVTAVGEHAFEDCSGLTGDLVIPNSVTIIREKAFEDCYGFNGNLVIPNSVTEIGRSAFKSCDGFTGDLVIPNSVTVIRWNAFDYCSGFNGNLVIPNSVTKIEGCAFENCNGFIGDLVIPNSVTEIGTEAFEYCEGFNGNLVISNSVTKIENQTFFGCIGFTGDLVIPNSVTELDVNAFWGCSGFNGNLVIPYSMAVIGDFAFDGCVSLGSITVESVYPPSVGIRSFYGISTTIPVCVPHCSLSLYQQSADWSYFSNFLASDYYELTVEPDFEESGSVAIIQQPDCDHDAIVQATPNEGLPFSGWMEDDVIVSTDNPYQFTLTKDTHLVACFGYYGLDDIVTMKVEVYPNPASEVVVVEGVDLKELEISNLFGQVLGHYQAAGEETRIDISTLPTGTYLLGITDACGKRSVRKMVKE